MFHLAAMSPLRLLLTGFLMGLGIGLASGYTVAILVVAWKTKRDVIRFLAGTEKEFSDDMFI